MISPREQALTEYNIARAVNKAIQTAGWLAQEMLKDQLEDDEDTMHPVAEAILALTVPFRPAEVEALYTRRDILIQKQYYPKWEKLTPEEEAEYKSLQEELAKLPSARDMDDQKLMDDMRMLSNCLKKGDRGSLLLDKS